MTSQRHGRPKRWRRALPAMAVMPLAWSVAAACLPGTGPALLPDEAGAASVDLGGDAGTLRFDASLGDPFAVEGLSPSHGPFTGGTRARIDGRGFSSHLEIFIGDTKIEPGAILASDPTRAAVVTPPGKPGFVDVRIRDEATQKERTLKNGFYYDAFVVSPDSGATSGGTRVAITGSGTVWGAGTKVSIGGVACNDVVVSSPTKLECVTPIGQPGSKDVVITPSDGPAVQARDAFTYSDSVDGYRGGLSGGALSGRIKVLAYDSFVGMPIEKAFAIAGGTLATAKVATTDANGVVEIGDVVGSKVTVTVAAKCFSPITFVDVPVDTVTVYLNPIIDPACTEGDPGTLPAGRQRFGGYVEGSLVFPGAGEFERSGWSTVPLPTKPTERQAAYVFDANPAPTSVFSLPSQDQAITPFTDAYKYSHLVFPGNVTLYVIAGLEDRSESPPKFLPYSMGVVRGVSVPAQARVQGVDIMMDVLFDHQVTLAATPPVPGPRGPDRFIAQLAVTLGSAGYAILPRGTRVSPLPLPSPGEIPFIGVPSLDHALAGEQYVLGGVATTGPEQRLPSSVVTRVRTTDANDTVALGGFLGVPVLGQPSAGVWSGRRIEFSGASGPVDLSVVHITSGGGLVDWTIVAPGGVNAFDVPDLAALPNTKPEKPGPGLIRGGAIDTTVYVARIEQFDYARLRYGQLNSGPWAAYAYDNLTGAY